MKMLLHRLTVGVLETNCCLVGCSETREAAVIDPGGDADTIRVKVEAESLRLRHILLTHGHGDHIAAVPVIKSAVPAAALAVHEADARMIREPKWNLSAAFGAPIACPPPDRLLRDGDEIVVGALRFQVIHVPGHTPGGAAFYGHGVVFCGDTLFAGGIGRTDLGGGSHPLLIASIKTRLLTLPPETVVYPGHGPVTTIGVEARSNPFL